MTMHIHTITVLAAVPSLLRPRGSVRQSIWHGVCKNELQTQEHLNTKTIYMLKVAYSDMMNM